MSGNNTSVSAIPVIFRWALWNPTADSVRMLSHSVGTFRYWFGTDPSYIVYADDTDFVCRHLEVDAQVLPMEEPGAQYVDGRATWKKWAPRFRHDLAATEFRVDSDIFLVGDPTELRAFINDPAGPEFMVTMESFKELWPYGNFGSRLGLDFKPINAGFFGQRAGADVSMQMKDAYDWWMGLMADVEVKYHDEQGALAWILQDQITSGNVHLLDPRRYQVVCPLNDPPVKSLDGIVGLHATYPEHPAYHQFIDQISQLSGVGNR